VVFSTASARGIDLEGGAIVENNTTLSLSRVVLLGMSNPHSNEIFVETGSNITGGSSGYVVGAINMQSVPNGSFVYPVGTVGSYSPVDLANASGGGSLRVVARTPQQPSLAAGTSLQRYWTLSKETGSLTTDLTFHYLDADIAGNENNYRLVIVEGGNATSFPNDANNFVTPASNTFTKLAVQSFSDWTAAEPAAPTAVKLTGFHAIQSGNEVKLSWQSGYEVNNLGYNLYRDVNGVRTPVTPSLIAGSALLAGRASLTAGLSYTWYDQTTTDDGRRATAQATVGGPQSSVVYWLEDVDLNGTRTLHGPIVPLLEYAGRKQRDPNSPLLSQVGRRTQASGVQLDAYASSFSATREGYGARIMNPDYAAVQRIVESLPGIRITVSRDGWYRITQPELVAAGLDPNVNAPQLQLFANGRKVPIKQTGDEVHLTASDYIEFYAHGAETTTDKAQTYYLVTDPDQFGTRIRDLIPREPQPPPPPTGANSYAYTVERKERMIYFSSLLNGDAENFFGQVVSNTAVTSAVPVNNLDAGGATAELEVTLQGVTQQSHEVRVLINGNQVGTMNFANTEHATAAFNVPAGVLHDGNNDVQFASLAGAADISLVDTLRLTYAHRFAADNNALSVSLDNAETRRVTGFTSNNLRVVDITDPDNVLELTQTVRVNDEGNGTFSVDMRVPEANERHAHTLIAFADTSASAPDAVRRNNPSTWYQQNDGADYVVITTAELQPGLEDLVTLRANQGLVITVVDVEDLYDEFSFGQHTPQAIRDYLERALTNWTRQPRYVVLAGDASLDPKNYFGQGLNDLVPTKLIDTTLAETASDDWLADLNNDGIADVAVGRLPLRTAAEMNALVAKMVSYEAATPDPSRGVLLVSDTGFETSSSAVQGLLPSGLAVTTINRSSADDATIRNQILAGLNQGPRVINYIGHGSNGVWTGASLLTNDDAPALTNTNRLSVFTMMTCYNGFFQNAFNDSLGEALLKSPGGAVAVWASTTLTDPAGQNAIDQEFYRQLFGGQQLTVGEAARNAKFVTTDGSVRRTWTLFGDPAMRLR
jgi:hypothetical protein